MLRRPAHTLAQIDRTKSVNHFARGWAWLVLDGDKLKITSLHDADTPVADTGSAAAH